MPSSLSKMGLREWVLLTPWGFVLPRLLLLMAVLGLWSWVFYKLWDEWVRW